MTKIPSRITKNFLNLWSLRLKKLMMRLGWTPQNPMINLHLKKNKKRPKKNQTERNTNIKSKSTRLSWSEGKFPKTQNTTQKSKSKVNTFQSKALPFWGFLLNGAKSFGISLIMDYIWSTEMMASVKSKRRKYSLLTSREEII